MFCRKKVAKKAYFLRKHKEKGVKKTIFVCFDAPK